ncbi:MAG: hypothetical protein CVV27_00720 [Candidatus Melainabacteria bacterium HGW-Melainabacteria-1]|nr:MAG: hypothetical protein CVV27_00720 [Candidatus Melainabacteria bacterium HGW-Melainabacteria-1]
MNLIQTSHSQSTPPVAPSRPTAAPATVAGAAVPSFGQADQQSLQNVPKGNLPSSPLSFVAPALEHSLFDSIGAAQIGQVLTQTLAGQSVEGYDPSRGAGPVDFALSRALMVLGNGSPQEQAQLALFKAAATRLANGEKPRAEDIEVLRLFGIGFASLGDDSFIAGIALVAYEGEGYQNKPGAAHEELPAEDFQQLLAVIQQMESLHQSAPAAFAATAAALRKNEKILTLQAMASQELKSAEAFALQAGVKAEEAAQLQEQATVVAQQVKAKQQETAELGKAVVQLVKDSADAIADPVAKAPEHSSAAPTSPPAGAILGGGRERDLSLALEATGIDPTLANLVADVSQTQPEAAKLVDLYLTSHAQGRELTTKLSLLDGEIDAKHLEVDKLLASSSQARSKAEKLIVSQQQETSERDQLLQVADQANAAAPAAVGSLLKRTLAPVVYTTHHAGRGLARQAQSVDALIAQTTDRVDAVRAGREILNRLLAEVLGRTGEALGKLLSQIKRNGPRGVRPQAPALTPAAAGIRLGVARTETSPAILNLTESGQHVHNERSRQLLKTYAERQLSQQIELRRDEAQHQTERRQEHDWQLYREARRTRLQA